MLRIALLACAMLNAAKAVSLEDAQDYCDDLGMEIMEANQIIRTSDTVIENKVIYGMPTDDSKENDLALKIVKGDNITIRNVVIFHAANTIGIYIYNASNVTLENVQVIAYGNDWGAAACPSRTPFRGYDCSNIKVQYTEGLVLNNVYTENGSRGISIVYAPNAILTNIVSKNVRGPFPAGQCVQMGYSDDTVLDNFTCINDLDIAWPEDSISAYRSSNISITNGVVEGSNAPTGICVMFEGSDPDVHDGLIENVEARYCQGCFSGYPINGLTQRNVTCASPVCRSDDPPRGGKDFVNMWTAGDNYRDDVYAYNIDVQDSFYYDPCDDSEGRIYWESRKGEVFSNGGPQVTELSEWEPKEAFENNFPWEGCFSAPEIDCSEFAVQEVGSTAPRVTVQTTTGETVYETVYGSCWPEEGG